MDKWQAFFTWFHFEDVSVHRGWTSCRTMQLSGPVLGLCWSTSCFPKKWLSGTIFFYNFKCLTLLLLSTQFIFKDTMRTALRCVNFSSFSANSSSFVIYLFFCWYKRSDRFYRLSPSHPTSSCAVWESVRWLKFSCGSTGVQPPLLSLAQNKDLKGHTKAGMDPGRTRWWNLSSPMTLISMEKEGLKGGVEGRRN